jgi:hypothetical protein
MIHIKIGYDLNQNSKETVVGAYIPLMHNQVFIGHFK